MKTIVITNGRKMPVAGTEACNNILKAVIAVRDMKPAGAASDKYYRLCVRLNGTTVGSSIWIRDELAGKKFAYWSPEKKCFIGSDGNTVVEFEHGRSVHDNIFEFLT